MHPSMEKNQSNRKRKTIMIINKLTKIALLLVTAALLQACGSPGVTIPATETKIGVELKRNSSASVNLGENVAIEPIYVEFKGSPVLTNRIRLYLLQLGYQLSESPQTGKAKFFFDGVYQLHVIQRKPITGPLSEFVENSAKYSAKANSSATSTTTPLPIIAGASILSGVVDAAGVAQWLGEKTGIAGAFNKAITGDERGLCIGKICNQYFSTITLFVDGGDNGKWHVRDTVVSEKEMLASLLSETLIEVLIPFRNSHQRNGNKEQ